jgi:hypothetical protein
LISSTTIITIHVNINVRIFGRRVGSAFATGVSKVWVKRTRYLLFGVGGVGGRYGNIYGRIKRA